MKFVAPRAVHVVDVQPVVGDRFLAPVRELQVVAGDQRRTVQVDPDGGTVSVRFDGRRVRSVTVRVLRAGTPAVRAPVALASIHVEGLTPRATLVVPSPVTRGSGFLFGTEPGTRPCVISGIGPDCDEARRRNPEEPQGLDRTVHVRDDVTLHVGGLVAARLTPKALRLLEPLGRVQRVRASSVMGNDPAVASRFAWDGSPGTAWVPAPTDAGPSLSFRWPEARSVSGLRVVAPDPLASPGRALITTAEGKRIAVDLNGSAMVRFPAVRTHRLQITFERPAADARIVVGEVQLRGVDVTQPFDREAPTGAICGLGPHVTVDGTVYQTSVRGTLGDLVDGHPLNLSVCGRGDRLGSGDEVPLRAGEHRLRAPPTSDFQTVNLTGTPSDRGSSATARAVDLQSWNGTHRTARVGAGPATVVWMPANANVGWRARLDGRSLERITVDGWQQGWLLPSGGGGRLVIDFPAQGWYGGVVAGALLPAALVLALALLLVVVPRRGGRRSVPVLGNGRPRLATAAVVVLVVALGGVAAGGALLAWLARRRTWPVASAGLGLVVSGVLDAYNHPAVPTDGVADVIAAAAFGVVLATAVLRGGAGS
jgi:arabinofuranan 3-O-arabinosyltransferase